MPRTKSGSRWWASLGCPAWITKSEWDAQWKPEEDFEEEFDALQGCATARRMLMNYFIFNPDEIADWQEETNRALWYRQVTKSLTLLHLRSKVEEYKSATNAERGSGDWMDRLFAETWTSAVAAPAALSAGAADDNLSGIDDDGPTVANGDDSPAQMASTEEEVDPSNMNVDGSPADEMDKVNGASELEQGTSANKDLEQVPIHDELDQLIAANHKKARLTKEAGQEIEDNMRPLFETGVVVNEDLRKALLGDEGSGGGKCDSDDRGISDSDDKAVAAAFAAAVIASVVANVEAGNGAQEGKTVDPTAAAAIASASTSSAASTAAAASSAATMAAAASTAAAASSASNGKKKMTAEQARAADSNVASTHVTRVDTDSDEEKNEYRRSSAEGEANAGHKRTIDALELDESSVVAMVLVAKDCSLPALGVEPSDPGGDRSVVWLQNHHLAYNVASQSVWRLFLLEHGELTFCTKEIFAGLGWLRPGVSPLLLASAPICLHKLPLARNGKAGIPGDEIDLMLSDGSAQRRGHAMSASVIRGMNELVTLKSVGHHGYVVLTFLQCFTHDATFAKDEAWLLDNYPHLVPLLFKPAAIVMANNGTENLRPLLLASVEDMSPGSKEAIFRNGRYLLMQKAKHLINEEMKCVDGSRLLFEHDISGRPIVNFQQLSTMRWAPDVFKKESVFNDGESGHQGSESDFLPPAVTATQGAGRKNAAPPKAVSLAAGTLRSAARPAAAALAASSPTLASSCSKSSTGSKSTQLVVSKPKLGQSSLKPKQGQSSVSKPKIADAKEEELLDVDEQSVVDSFNELLGVRSPTFDSLDIAGALANLDAQAKRTCTNSGVTAAFNYVKGRTSMLVNNAWKNNLLKMEAKAHQATMIDELQTVERMAKSYYEDLVSAMNVLSSLAQKFSASYTPHGKQANMLESHFQAVILAVTRSKARLEESANEKKRSRAGTLSVHPQPSLPGEFVDVIKQIVDQAKRPRPEAKEADTRVRELEMTLEIAKATHEAESKHGSKMAAQESSFQAEKNLWMGELHAAQIQNAKYSAAAEAKAEMQADLTRVTQCHFESSNAASCLKGALMMQSCTSFVAGGMSSPQVMGADQGYAALLGCLQSAPGGLNPLLPTAPRNHVLPVLKGPANETKPLPPHVAHDVQKLMTEVEHAIELCAHVRDYEGAAALQKWIIAFKQTVEEIAVLEANLTEYKRLDAFEECTSTKGDLDKAVTKLNEQKDAVRKTLTHL